MKKVYLGLLVLVLCFVVVGLAAAQNQKAEWQKSKHANRELAADDAATWEDAEGNDGALRPLSQRAGIQGVAAAVDEG